MKELLLSKVSETDRPFVREFCKRFNTELMEIDATTENNVMEPLYLFNDDLGGYTIDGVRSSLEGCEWN